MKTNQLLEITGSYNAVGIKNWRQTVYGVHSVCISPHWHEQLEILYIVRGEIELNVGEDAFRGIPGMAIIVNPKQIHAGVCMTDELEYDVLQIDLTVLQNNSFVSHQYINSFLQEKVRFTTVLRDPAAVAVITDLFRCICSSPHPLTVIGQIYQALGDLYLLCAVEQGVFHTSNEKFRQVLEYIDAHYTEPLSARSVSCLFNYNESYFCRLFKQMTGLTLSAYVRFLRMEKAQQLLKQQDIPIAQVAIQCGYTDANYFCLCVRKHFRLSPTELRQKMLNT